MRPFDGLIGTASRGIRERDSPRRALPALLAEARIPKRIRASCFRGCPSEAGKSLLLFAEPRRTIVSYPQFHPRKNDFAFALLMSAVFAGVVGAVAGTVKLVVGPVSVDSAKVQGTTVALRGPGDPAQPVEPSGARK